MQLTLFRRRVFSGQTLMSIAKGIENGLPTADMSPWEFAPTAQQQLQWPKWGQYFETKGHSGEPPDLPSAKRLMELYEAWLGTAERALLENKSTMAVVSMAELFAPDGYLAGLRARGYKVVEPI